MKLTLKNFQTFFTKNKNKTYKLFDFQLRHLTTNNSQTTKINNDINPNTTNNSKNETINKENKTEIYMWISSVVPGRKREDYSNRFIFSHNPMKLDFFDDKNPKQVFAGPRHNAVITGDGNLYTFGDGYRGVLGHGNDMSVSYRKPKIVSYFSENNIKIKKVVLGDSHSLALAEDGDLYSWGYGGKIRAFLSFYKEYGYIGHPDLGSKFFPTVLPIFKDEGIKIKDISCGIKHSIALTVNGDLYTWGKGHYGLNGDGKNNSLKLPKKNEFFRKLKEQNEKNEIIKLDSADEFSGALTKGGDLYVWGKNDKGQLGTGAGIGIDYTESEKYPLLVKGLDNVKIIDFHCGENTMLIKDHEGKLYRTGLKVDYTPSLIEITQEIRPKLFFCGNSYYCIVSEKDDIYQWGNLFKNSKIEKNDTDMLMIKSKDIFDGKEIENVSCKYKVAGAIVKC